MDIVIKKLRRKYIMTASLIAFSVIFIMILVLNVLMGITYKNERKMLEGVISQTVLANNDGFNTEYFKLSDMPKNEDGDFIISRNIRDVSNITLHGTITCDSKSAAWYTAGGGLMFDINTDSGKKLVYKEYTFNKDTTDISIDFENYDNIKFEGNLIDITEEQIIGDYFLVSIVWWGNSSEQHWGKYANVNLIVDSIEVHYNEPISTKISSDHIVTHNSFSDIFGNSIPDILGNTTAFYLVTDSKNNLVSINDGNLINPVDDNNAESYIKQIAERNKKSGKINVGNLEFSFSVCENENIKIIVFTNEASANKAQNSLLYISVFIGILICIILFVLIFIISGNVIKPVSESFQHQKEFISNASHELKTPVTVISTTIDILSRQKGEDKWTDCIKEQSKKMHHLVNELLDLSRLSESKDKKGLFEKCNISHITKNNLLYFESRLFENKKTLEQNIENDIFIMCDENKISQLIGILVDNAIKYSDDNSQINFTLCKKKDKAVFTCENKCTDFTIKDTSKMFERFYRSDNDHSNEQSGFGLGLSIAQAITHLHNGKISAQYNENIVKVVIEIPI